MSGPIYRGWSVHYDPPPIPNRSFDWQATHPNYDASWEGEEDGFVDNGLKANAATYEQLCAEIDEIEAELAEQSPPPITTDEEKPNGNAARSPI